MEGHSAERLGAWSEEFRGTSERAAKSERVSKQKAHQPNRKGVQFSVACTIETADEKGNYDVVNDK